jgi:hypothetical protein
VLLSKNRITVEKRSEILKDLIIERIAMEYEAFEQDLEEKIENEKYESINNNAKKNKEIQSIFDNPDGNAEDGNMEKDSNYHNEDVTVLKVETLNWDILYLSLVTLEKFISNYHSFIKNTLKSSQTFQYIIIKCLKHPHMFIKSITNRLIASIFDEIENSKAFYSFVTSDEEDDTSFNPVEFLFTNFRFMMVNSDTSDKVIKQTVSNSVFLIKNCSKIQSDLNNHYANGSYEFLCRLYIESKSYLTNKDVSRIIFNRICDLFESLSNELVENEMKFYLDPILSLSYRIIDNKLVENNLKSRVNKVKFYLIFNILSYLKI